jgi:rSAM/selenodomain-associated transferase 1
MTSASAILVMAKAPRAGHVNTRLAPVLGDDGCARLQEVLLRRTTELAWTFAPSATFVAFDPPDAGGEVARLAPAGAVCFPQLGADLGERLVAATEVVLATGHGPLLVIGTDVPLLGRSHLRDALDLLSAGRDLVFGPACDGGYYLVGLARSLPLVFGIRAELWGGPLVLEASLGCARAAGLRVGVSAPLRDLDTPDDAQALLNEPGLRPEVREILAGADHNAAGKARKVVE